MSGLRDLDVQLHEDRIYPRWLMARDRGWVDELERVLAACEGLPRSHVEGRLRLQRSRAWAPKAWERMSRLLLRRRGYHIGASVEPRRARRELFEAAARARRAPRAQVINEVAARLKVEPPALEASLYADLPERRLLGAEPGGCRPGEATTGMPDGDVRPPSVGELLELYNLDLAQAILGHAQRVVVEVQGRLGPLLRWARLQGLLVEARAPLGGKGAEGGRLELSGPASVLRLSRRYGAALARWLPALTAAGPWSLEATCLLEATRMTVAFDSRDPIGTTHRLGRAFDSTLERVLFRALQRHEGPWRVEREADVSQVGEHLLSSDFTLVDDEIGMRVAVEVVGFWTPATLERKLRLVRGLERPWILCVDEELAARAGVRLPADEVLTFRKRVPADALITMAERRRPLRVIPSGGLSDALRSPSRDARRQGRASSSPTCVLSPATPVTGPPHSVGPIPAPVQPSLSPGGSRSP